MRKQASSIALILFLATTAHAEDAKDKNIYDTACPPTVLANATDQFGYDANNVAAADLTNCIGVRSGIQIVVAINSSDANGASGQQIKNIQNIVKDYKTNYGMTSGVDFEIVAVGYGPGLKWLIQNDANPFETSDQEKPIDDLMKIDGVKFFACQNTMKGKSWTTSDLIPGVEMTPAGVTGVIDFQKRGYVYITP